MQIGDLIDSEIMQLYPIDFARELLNMFSLDPTMGGQTDSDKATASTGATAGQESQAATAAPQQPVQPHIQKILPDLRLFLQIALCSYAYNIKTPEIQKAPLPMYKEVI